jgi:hypothetical protein
MAELKAVIAKFKLALADIRAAMKVRRSKGQGGAWRREQAQRPNTAIPRSAVKPGPDAASSRVVEQLDSQGQEARRLRCLAGLSSTFRPVGPANSRAGSIPSSTSPSSKRTACRPKATSARF